MEVTVDTLVSLQECNLSLSKAVDEAHRHTDIDGLAGALGQTASETDTAQVFMIAGTGENDLCLS